MKKYQVPSRGDFIDSHCSWYSSAIAALVTCDR